MPALLDATRELRQLAELAAHSESVDQVLGRALDNLRALVPYDLAAVLELSGETLRVRLARGPLADERVRTHSVQLEAYPTVRRVMESRRPMALLESHHDSDEGDPYDGVLDLPHGHSCMVVPLFAGDRSIGIMTFDRTECAVYPPEVVELAGVYGQIAGLAIVYAEQAALLDRYRRRLQRHHRQVVEEHGGGSVAGEMLSSSHAPRMAALVQAARQVAVTDASVLIQGETGVGKEVLAQALHEWSPRRDAAFVKLNCAAVPEHLLESELFGHVKGAFSGAERDRPGRFLTANGGTLLLDEVGDLPLAAQAKLLRVLQDGTFEALGSDVTIKVDVRVLAATHVDLEGAVAAGRFRQDLFFRLAVFPLRLPALRERVEDIAIIAQDVLERIARRTGRGPWVLSAEGAERLRQEPWPGNVRQLVNVLERATILQPEGVLRGEVLLPTAPPTEAPRARAGGLRTLREVERQHIIAALAHTGGRIYGEQGAAVLLGLKPTTLQSRMKKLGVRRTG